MVCVHPDCNNRIRSSNKNKVCQSHYKFTGSCKKCTRRCWVQAEYCSSCSRLKKSFDSRARVVCQYSGCTTLTTSKYNLCQIHFGDFKPCRIEGCGELVKYNSKWGFCAEHRVLTRYHKEDGLERLPPVSPLPIKRRRLGNVVVGS